MFSQIPHGIIYEVPHGITCSPREKRPVSLEVAALSALYNLCT